MSYFARFASFVGWPDVDDEFVDGNAVALVKPDTPLHYYPAMPRCLKSVSFLALGLTLIAAAGAARAAPEIIDPEDIRPGMKGYGLTVFEGTEPTRFDVEVISVVPNFLLRQDIVLIRVSHPVTDHAGVIGGMSGSPIYIEGKLAGALAYGWRFSKDSLAGVTPIKDMYEVLGRKLHTPVHHASQRRRGAPFSPLAGLDYRQPDPDPYFRSFGAHDEEQFAPARTPLALSGFVGESRAMLEEALAPYGLDPVQGGGAGSGEGPTAFEPGASIGVQLIRGDLSAAAIGTVTAVRDEHVLAFGHPMFNMGQGFLPVTAARIHTVVASINRSNKIGSPLRELGSLVQDRQAGILARIDRKAPMIPVVYRLRDGRGKRAETYRVEMIGHRLLTPRFLQAVLRSIVLNAASDITDVTAEVKGVLTIVDRDEPVTLYDSGASRTGLGTLTGYFRPFGIVAAVLDNPFEDAEVEALQFDVDLHYGLKVSTIVGVYLTAAEPAPGDVVNVHVRLRPYGGGEEVVTVPVRIPQVPEGEKIQFEVAGGDFLAPVLAEPQNLDDMIENVERLYPARSLVVGINVPGEGVSLRGRVLERLPPSVVTALKPAAGVEQLATHRTALREVVPMPYLVAGKETISVEVGSRRDR
jgi:hypothetical protein